MKVAWLACAHTHTHSHTLALSRPLTEKASFDHLTLPLVRQPFLPLAPLEYHLLLFLLLLLLLIDDELVSSRYSHSLCCVLVPHHHSALVKTSRHAFHKPPLTRQVRCSLTCRPAIL